MPRERKPPKDMPDVVVHAIRAIAPHGRAEIVRFLRAHPGSTAGEIINGTDIDRDALRKTLPVLEGTGFLRTDVDGDRARRTVRYWIDEASFTQAFDLLAGYLRSDSGNP
ncbi:MULTISPECIES: ArsR family transcriptional regulator [unclassified Microbacterium]|uniref:ArsR family transcriptional regulator n=1 Tax=unclassified Microbacterium TaxID=2609290 RepID=UPI003019FCD7